ncbi:hypothetical protein [Nocardia asiatica]|uniref:hypothetical protein n=1 Tax=Nocardia asiatica TaxID=209252 RepID=UPI002458DF2A|nr:hypothetical protein [Nocardia asiatica]
MTIHLGDTVTLTDQPGRYRVDRIAHGKALILPITPGAARVVALSRLAQAAAAPTT